MINKLKSIITQKEREVAILQAYLRDNPHDVIGQIMQGKIRRESPKSFKNALLNPFLAVIAEIKRRSPSKGILASIDDPVALATTYAEGGAVAISILTDETFFGGQLNDLKQVATAFANNANPILRKDFIIHECQIAEAIAAGADAILCIVAVTGENTKNILDAAKAMGIDVLVEIHDESELVIALRSGAEIIGVNNRNLSTFKVDVQQAHQLVKKIPADIVKVAESGILDPVQAREFYNVGYDAVLIGEALVKSPDPTTFIRACCHE